MKNTLRIIIFLFCLSSLNNICFGQEKGNLTMKELFKIYRKKLIELNLPGINLNDITLENFSVYYQYDERLDKTVPGIGCKLVGFSMRVDPTPGKILSCSNQYIAEKTGSLSGVVFKGGAKPARNKEDIVKEAERYVEILNGEIPKEACLWEVDYNVGAWQKPGYSYEGVWIVRWGRKEGDYKYYSDSICVMINESLGLSSYGYNFYSDYHPPKKINISRYQAVKIAQKNVNKIINSSFFDSLMRYYKADKVDSAELLIINPNYSHKLKSMEDPYCTRNARLAWVVKFTLSVAKTGKADPNLLQVWIDAETGEVLGGE